MKDPVELQCLAEQLHAVVVTITDIAEHNKAIDISDDTLLVLYRAQGFTYWLKETCFNIHEIEPGKDLVNDISAALQRVESLSYLCQWQQSETLNNHIRNALKDVSSMASDCQAEVKRLWGQV